MKMVVLAVAVLAALWSCAAGCSGNANQLKNGSFAVQLAALFKELESLRCEQTTLQQQQQSALTQMHQSGRRERAPPTAGTHSFTFGGTGGDGDGDGDVSRRQLDPCFHYTVLDEPWRASNASSKEKMCDRNVKWSGWYRLFYRGRSLQMPERCVPVNRCGTHAPLWLAGPHPRRRDGVVSRHVCGHWQDRCCAFRSAPIQVKKCRGNYYVYRFTKPSSCYLAYCADINTLVCGRCSRKQECVSRDKINWRCQDRRQISRKVHFFASLPAQLSGKVNRIRYSRVLVNVGGAFSRRSGVFRAPVGGVYQFFFSTQAAPAGLKTDLWLVVNDYWVAASHTQLPADATAGSLSTYMTFLSRGAVVYVTHNCGKSWADAASSTITFGGSLLVQGKG